MPRSPRKAARTAFPLLAIALAVWCATAWASPTITIEMPDAESKSLDLATIDPEPAGTSYRIRRKQGEDYDLLPVDEYYEMADVLKAVGALDGFKEATLDSEGAVRVSKDQLNDVPPPALFVDDEGRVRFIRNSTGPKDDNYNEYLSRFEVKRMTLSSSSSFELTANANRRSKAGEVVTFQGYARGGGSGKIYKLEWDFDDGSATATGREVTHTYDEPGTYLPKVSVVTADSDGERGEEVVEGFKRLKVIVGKPKDESGDPGAGGGNDAAGAPDSGTYDGSSGAGSSYGDTSTTTPYTPSSPTDPFDDSTTDQDPAPSTFGDTVEGALLASVSTTAPNAATESAARAAQSGDPDFDVPEPDDDVPPVAWAGIGALFLMGAGAGLESGRRPRLRRPRLRLSIPRR